MPAPSLYHLAKRKLIQNITLLTDIGDLPYDFLSPILKHIQNPSQLAEIEANCPQIQGETSEIWLRFIQRDIPNWDKKPHEPRDQRKWSKVYMKLKKEAEQEKEEEVEKLKQTMRALQQDRSGNATQIVEGRVGYNPAMRAAGRFGPARGSAFAAPRAPPKTGKLAFDKLRRGIFDQKREMPKASLMPSHLLAERKGQVRQIPPRVIRERELEAEAARNRMRLSKGASASVAGITDGSAPSRALPQSTGATTSDKIHRRTLPPGQTFTAPKIRTQPATQPTAQKRRRDEPAMFMAPKKRKV